jgi:hypothetical protein
VIVVTQLLPGHGESQRLASVVTIARQVTGPVMPVVSNVTSVPVVDESLPPVVVHAHVVLPGPVITARSETRSPSVTLLAEATMLQVTAGQGGSVTSKVEAHVDCPLETQPEG